MFMGKATPRLKFQDCYSQIDKAQGSEGRQCRAGDKEEISVEEVTEEKQGVTMKNTQGGEGGCGGGRSQVGQIKSLIPLSAAKVGSYPT